MWPDGCGRLLSIILLLRLGSRSLTGNARCQDHVLAEYMQGEPPGGHIRRRQLENVLRYLTLVGGRLLFWPSLIYEEYRSGFCVFSPGLWFVCT